MDVHILQSLHTQYEEAAMQSLLQSLLIFDSHKNQGRLSQVLIIHSFVTNS